MGQNNQSMMFRIPDGPSVSLYLPQAYYLKWSSEESPLRRVISKGDNKGMLQLLGGTMFTLSYIYKKDAVYSDVIVNLQFEITATREKYIVVV
jgi:hypothetical protein